MVDEALEGREPGRTAAQAPGASAGLGGVGLTGRGLRRIVSGRRNERTLEEVPGMSTLLVFFRSPPGAGPAPYRPAAPEE